MDNKDGNSGEHFDKDGKPNENSWDRDRDSEKRFEATDRDNEEHDGDNEDDPDFAVLRNVCPIDLGKEFHCNPDKVIRYNMF